MTNTPQKPSKAAIGAILMGVAACITAIISGVATLTSKAEEKADAVHKRTNVSYEKNWQKDEFQDWQISELQKDNRELRRYLMSKFGKNEIPQAEPTPPPEFVTEVPAPPPAPVVEAKAPKPAPPPPPPVATAAAPEEGGVAEPAPPKKRPVKNRTKSRKKAASGKSSFDLPRNLDDLMVQQKAL